jgi:ABC-2 type transport system permease protein
VNGELSVWRVEWIRLLRTRRWLALGGVFVLFGFIGPLVAKYTSQLLSHAGGDKGTQITIIVPPPVPADGVSGYTGNALQVGLVVTMVIAAFACAIDAKPALSVFYRTRARRFADLVVPRFTVTAAGAVAAYLVGLLASWYETAVLIGDPGIVPMLETALVGSLYLVFAVAVTALTATVARSTLGTVGYALVVMLALPIAGAIPDVSRWLPSTLSGAPYAFVQHTNPDHYQRALLLTVLLTAAVLALAVVRGARREVR